MKGDRQVTTRSGTKFLGTLPEGEWKLTPYECGGVLCGILVTSPGNQPYVAYGDIVVPLFGKSTDRC